MSCLSENDGNILKQGKFHWRKMKVSVKFEVLHEFLKRKAREDFSLTERLKATEDLKLKNST